MLGYKGYYESGLGAGAGFSLALGPQGPQPLFHHVLLVDLAGHQDQGGYTVDGVGVVLLEYVGQQLGRLEVLHLVDYEPLAPHDAPATDVKDLDGRFQLVFGQGEAVEVFGPLAHHLLFFDGFADRACPVPPARRQFELKVGGRIPHPGLEALQDGRGIAIEEHGELVDQARVLVVLDMAGARPGAAFDVVHQAGPAQALVPGELGVAATAHRERAQQQVQRLADGVSMGVGPEVAVGGTGVGPAPAHRRPRPLLSHREHQEGVALVVAQAHVEPGLVLLDEAVLEHEGLDVVADLDPLDARRRRHHLGRPGRQGGGRLEVVGQALAQRLRLAYVDDATIPVPELVTAGSVRYGPGGRSFEHCPHFGAARLPSHDHHICPQDHHICHHATITPGPIPRHKGGQG